LGDFMMYPYVTLNDDTEITHSELLQDGRVKVYIETPDLKDGFHHAVCYLPDYTWEDVNGYSEAEGVAGVKVCEMSLPMLQYRAELFTPAMSQEACL
jgi:hypothetical protein